MPFPPTGTRKPLPPDLQRFIADNFAPEDRETAISLLAGARIETGAVPDDRLLRCAAYACRQSLASLQRYVEMLAIDWRDVVVAGECELRDGKLVHVRDMTQPLVV